MNLPVHKGSQVNYRVIANIVGTSFPVLFARSHRQPWTGAGYVVALSPTTTVGPVLKLEVPPGIFGAICETRPPGNARQPSALGEEAVPAR